MNSVRNVCFVDFMELANPYHTPQIREANGDSTRWRKAGRTSPF